MGQYNLNLTAIGPHGCDRKAREGEKLYGRCGRFGCPDCMAYDFVQQLRAKGMTVEHATFTHWPGTAMQVVDDLLANARTSGQF